MSRRRRQRQEQAAPRLSFHDAQLAALLAESRAVREVSVEFGARPDELSALDYRILLVIRNHHPARVGEIGKRLAIKPNTVSQRLSRLLREKKIGPVILHHERAGRVSTYDLTMDGVRLVDAIARRITQEWRDLQRA